MNLDNLKWVKNVKHKNTDRHWAYADLNEMVIPEAQIFRLHWSSNREDNNAQKPQKNDLALLLQRAKVTHIVEFLDNEVYGNTQNRWGIYRIVKSVWMPLEKSAWENLPHQREIFGFDYVVGDGNIHNLVASNRMPQFHRYWDERGGLEAFYNRLNSQLAEIT